MTTNWGPTRHYGFSDDGHLRLVADLISRPDDTARVRNKSIEAMFGTRRTVRTALEVLAQEPDVEVWWTENKGLITSTFAFTARGRCRDLARALAVFYDTLAEV